MATMSAVDLIERSGHDLDGALYLRDDGHVIVRQRGLELDGQLRRLLGTPL